MIILAQGLGGELAGLELGRQRQQPQLGQAGIRIKHQAPLRP